ncbi:Ankyrin-3 [Colletotrichum sp. SAR 10_98]|nr:Ankyrin-3 [Colletotrichum sp. SAR 10_98]
MKETASSSPSERVRASLETIPPETVLLIADFLFGDTSRSAYDMEDISDPANAWRFDPERDVIRLAATCRKLRTILTPAIYNHDVQHNYSSALFIAAKKGITSAVLLSLQAGADVNAQDRTMFDYYTYSEESNTERYPVQSSFTALHWAAFFGNEELAKLLIARGADVNARADMGYRYYLWDDTEEWAEEPLDSSNPQMIMFCHSEKESDDSRRSGYFGKRDTVHIGATPLFFALKADTTSANYFRWLIQVDDPCDDRKRVLNGNESDKRSSMAKLLIRHGSSLLTREYGAIHALHQATAYGNEDMIKLLIDEIGVCPNTSDEDGNTPLHYLTRGDIPRSVGQKALQLLLDRGADPNLQNSDGLIPEYQHKWRLNG